MAMRITRNVGGVHRTRSRAHVQMYYLFPYLGNSCIIALNFGTWLETDYLSVSQKSMVGYNCTCARGYPFSVNPEQQDELH